MDARIVIVDPFDDEDLLELAELSGLPFTRLHAWPFEAQPVDRLVSTVPVPRGAGREALGVVPTVALTPKLGEAWPERVVSLRDGREDILAFLGGADAPGGTRVGVVGLAGGIGTSTLAACLARALADRPIAVALMDTDPVPGLASRLGLDGYPGLRWADLTDESGPLLPRRLDLPVWHRVRVATSDVRGAAGAPFTAAANALSRTHDVLVLDLQRTTDGEDLLGQCDHVVVVFGGTAGEVAAWERLRTTAPRPTLHPVVRAGGGLAPGDLARRLGTPVVTLGTERTAVATRGVQPGDRRRGAVMTAARLLADRVMN
ncbi:MAG: hypothetical protein ACQERF_02390 [Actinomycetota bacterium]